MVSCRSIVERTLDTITTHKGSTEEAMKQASDDLRLMIISIRQECYRQADSQFLEAEYESIFVLARKPPMRYN